MDKPFARGRGSGRSLNCDRCRRGTDPYAGYFRCEDTGCDYDVCRACGEQANLSQMPVGKKIHLNKKQEKNIKKRLQIFNERDVTRELLRLD